MGEKAITADMIRELRERTGVGMGKCKEALDAAKGDLDLAIEHLRKTGMASAVKKEGRETKEGLIKVAQTDKAIALLEINAETDFVVKNERFTAFAQDLAQEACNSLCATLADFLAQKYSKDPSLTIDQHRAVVMQSLGENIQLRRLEIFLKKSSATIGTYSHMGGKIVTLVQIEGSADEQELATGIAMHIAAEAPEFLSADEVPARIIEHEQEIARAQIKNKPPQIIDQIIKGKVKAYCDQICLLSQHYVRDTSLTIKNLVDKRAKEIGKPLKVSQFLRWHIGG